MNVRLQYSLPFTAAVYWQDQVIMNNYLVRVYMVTNSYDPASQNIAFERIKHMIYNEFFSTVFINQELEHQCKLLTSAGVKITTMPAEPVDQLLGIMLYCKLNAVMEDRIVVNEIEISSEIGANMTYLHAADENLGPFEVEGWWHDPDPIHCDIGLITTGNILPLHRAGAWRELDLAWPDADSDNDNNNTVVFTDFKNNETK